MSHIDTRLTMQLAHRLRAVRPASGEGALALAAWRRCVFAIEDAGVVSDDDRAAFHVVAGTDEQ